MLDDLRGALAQHALAERLAGAAGRRAPTSSTCATSLAYWADGFDWRAQERA